MSKIRKTLFRIALILGLVLFGFGIVGAAASTLTPLGAAQTWLWVAAVGIVVIVARSTAKANVSHE